MSKQRTKNRVPTGANVDEPVVEDMEEELEEAVEETPVETPISDRRARRKRKRGELVDEAVEATDKKNRATPSRRQTAKAPAKQPNFFERLPIVGGLARYFNNVLAEMKKVTWPSREETIRLTRMVIIITIIFSIALGILDLFYTWWLAEQVDETSLFLGIGAGFLLILAALSWILFYREDQSLPY